MEEKKATKKKKSDDTPTLSEIPSVGPTTEEKLGNHGYAEVINVAVAVPKNLSDITGMSEAACRKVIQHARSLMNMDFVKGTTIDKEQEEKVSYLSLGCQPLDDLVGGGLRSGWITEAFGAWGCHSEDTKVLTIDGEKNYYELDEGDYIIGVDEDNNMVPTKITKRFIYNYNGELYEFKTRRLNLMVTPNHKVYFKRIKNQDFKKIEAEEAFNNVGGYFPSNFNYKSKNNDKLFDIYDYISFNKDLKYPKKSRFKKLKPMDINDFMELLGWYISEGFIFKCKRGNYVGIAQTKKEGRIHIENLLDRLGFNYGKYKTQFVIFHQDLAEYFMRAGSYCYWKEIPREIFRYNKENLEHLFKTLMMGDGEKSGYKYYTSSKKLKEQMLTLCYLLGYSAAYKTRKWKNTILADGREIKQTTDNYVVNIAPNPKGYFDKRTHMNKVKYNGKVWCFETETGNFFTVRDGTPAFSGNSSKTQIAFQLCVTSQFPKEEGGLGEDSKVVFIDTENTFVASRIKQIAESKGLDPEKVMKNILYIRVFNSDHQIFAVQQVRKLIQDKQNVKLIIVDSLTAHFRSDFSGRGELYDRQSSLNRHMRFLANLATQYNLAVFVTNQVMANPAAMFGDPTVAVGGHILGHNSTVRLYLRRAAKGTRVAKLVDSPNLQDGECAYIVTDKGLEEV